MCGLNQWVWKFFDKKEYLNGNFDMKTKKLVNICYGRSGRNMIGVCFWYERKTDEFYGEDVVVYAGKLGAIKNELEYIF